MKKSVKKYFLIGLSIFIFSCTFFTPIFNINAKEIERLNNDPNTGHFELGPTRLTLEANQGEKLEREITVANHTGERMGFVMEFQDFTFSNDPDIGYEFIEEATEEISAKNWFEPELDEFEIEHGEKIHLNIKITVPEDAILGDHQAGIFIRSKKAIEGTDRGATVKISTRLGIPIVINVNGTKDGKKIDINQNADFTDFTADNNFYEKGPVRFSLNVKNSGNVHVNPSGYITIKRFGREVDKIDVKEWRVYRESEESQKVEWNEGFLIGKYEAEAVLNMDINGERQEFRKNLEFTVVPWRNMSYVLALLILFIIFAVVYSRRRYKKLEKKILKRLGKTNPEIGALSSVTEDKSSEVDKDKKIKSTLAKLAKKKKMIFRILIVLILLLFIVLIVTSYMAIKKDVERKESIIFQQAESEKNKYKEIQDLKQELKVSKQEKELAEGTTGNSQESNKVLGASQNNEADIIKADISIEVLNGNGIKDAAHNFSLTLNKLGFTNVTKVYDADNFKYEGVIIRYALGKRAKADLIKNSITEKYEVFLQEVASQTSPDVRIIVGN